MKLDKINVFCVFLSHGHHHIPIKHAKIDPHENYVSTKSAKINHAKICMRVFQLVYFLQKTDDFERKLRPAIHRPFLTPVLITLFGKFSLGKVTTFFPWKMFPEHFFLLFSNLFLQNFPENPPRNREN